MRKSWKILGLVGLVTLSSCLKDEYNFEEIKADNYNPTIAAPLLAASVNLGQVMENIDTTQIRADENNLLRITYSDTLLSYNVAELVEIPTQSISESFTLDAFSIDDLSNSVNVTLGELVDTMPSTPATALILANDGGSAPFPAINQGIGEFALTVFDEFNTVRFSDGDLSLEITNNWPFDIISIDLTIENVSDGSIVGTYNFTNIPRNGEIQSRSVDLTGVTMSNELQANISNFQSDDTGGPVGIQLNSTLEITSTASGLEVSDGTAIFPDQDAINDQVDVDLTLDNGELLNTVTLNEGSINYSINYGLRENAQVVISLPYITMNGNSIREVIDVTSDHINTQVINGSIDLTGHTIDLTANGTNTNYIEANIEASIISSGEIVPFSTTDEIVADLEITDLSIEYVEGYLGNTTESITPDTINIDLFNNEFSELISLAAPVMTLRMTNSAGIPVTGDLSGITAFNSESSTQLTSPGLLDELVINYPENADAPDAVTEVELTRDNSNLPDVFNSNPEGIAYEVQIETNPTENTSINNFLNDDSKIDVTMNVDVPMYGSIRGFVIEDTLDFSFETENFLKSAMLRTVIENQFPVDADIQLYFTDENYNVLDSLFSEGERLVQSSSIDDDGELVSATTSETDITLTGEKLEHLLGASKVILYSKLETANGGQQDAKFYTHYEMNIKLGVLATIQF